MYHEKPALETHEKCWVAGAPYRALLGELTALSQAL